MTDPSFVRQRHVTDGRDLSYPPLPEALTVPVYDNHTHLEIADGEQPLDYREQLDRASSVGVRGVVQVGNDVEGRPGGQRRRALPVVGRDGGRRAADAGRRRAAPE